MEINIPDVLLDLTKAFNQYEEALLSNQPEILNELFWRSPLTIRYGVAENLYGYDAIVGYRNTRASQGGAPPRETRKTVVTTYGRDFGTTNIEYVRTQSGRKGRQSQTWVRTEDGWRIVGAHVSLLADKD